MEAYSDGVFSIAGTLLVLDIALNPPGTALEQVLHAWPAYLGYLISFLTIGAAWIGHSAMTDRLTHVDRSLLGINLMLLLVVAFLPFPTKLIADGLGDQNGERVFVTMYGLTLLTIRLISFLLDAYARHEHLYSAPEADEEVEEVTRSVGRSCPCWPCTPSRSSSDWPPRRRPSASTSRSRCSSSCRSETCDGSCSAAHDCLSSTTSPDVADAADHRSVDNQPHMTASLPKESTS